VSTNSLDPLHLTDVLPRASIAAGKGKTDKSARDHFFYFSGSTPSAVRYKNWKMYYNMSQPGPAGWIMPLVPFHFTLVQNIKRDPFEQNVGIDQKSAMSLGGALGGPLTAFQYDWNMLPIGQQLWLEHLLSYEKFPPLQAPETYNLTGILDMVRKANANHAGDQGRETSLVSPWGRPAMGRPQSAVGFSTYDQGESDVSPREEAIATAVRRRHARVRRRSRRCS